MPSVNVIKSILFFVACGMACAVVFGIVAMALFNMLCGESQAHDFDNGRQCESVFSDCKCERPYGHAGSHRYDLPADKDDHPWP